MMPSQEPQVTLRFGLVGMPVRASASPAMHRAALQAMGLPHCYELIECREEAQLEGVLQALRRRNYTGLNVTLPYKRAVLSLVDDVHVSVDQTGAANTLLLSAAERVVAYNTDLPALSAELRALLPPSLATVVILGSGGAAFSALAACKELGARVIAMTSRSWQTSEAVYESPVAADLRERGALTLRWPSGASAPMSSNLSGAMQLQWAELAATADLIIQATSAGMIGGASGHEVAALIPWRKLRPSTRVLDVVYGPPTPFLQAARAAGLRAVSGVGMLVRQGALALELWTRQRPPLQLMEQAVLQHVAQLETQLQPQVP